MVHEPYATLRISDPAFGRLGYLVIDTTYRGNSVGGVRILPDVTFEEISAMARTMTRKYLFSGIPSGGAKAGIMLQGRAAKDRAGALKAFGRALSPYIYSGFWPGCDMGSSMEDIRGILAGAGLFSFMGEPPPSHRYTAWSVIESIDAALERKEMDWEGCRLAVEGFGKVGSLVAKMAYEKGAKVIAISNMHGALHSPSGLDVPRLQRMGAEHGSGFMRLCEGTQPKESIFSMDCDVFVPCARCWSINSSNVSSIRADIIAGGANVPMDRECERHLWSKGKLIVPDAVANCGGVVGATLARSMSDDDISSVLKDRFRKRVHDVLSAGAPPSEHLEGFYERRRQELSDALAPRAISPAMRLADFIKYHTLERLTAARDKGTSLFPG